MNYPTKLRAGKYMVPITIIDEGKKLRLKFGYNKILLAHVKDFQGAQWQPEKRSWVINNNERNLFQLRYLAGENVYERYDRPLIEVVPNRPNLYKHQIRLLRHGLTRHYGIWAADPGVGKTLAAIELMEHSGFTEWLYIAPKSALNAVILELQQWNCLVRPKMMTYDALRTTVGVWKGQAPKGVIFDESSRLKNPQSQRSQSALYLANCVREEWGEDGFVILMSGTPAPRDPTDWWSQCITRDTWILTTEGPRQVNDLISRSFSTYVDSRSYHVQSGFHKVGCKPVYLVTTKEGYSFTGTCDHRALISYDQLKLFCRIDHLKVGTRLCLNQHRDLEWGGEGTYEEGYIIGHLIGDGTTSKSKRSISGYSTTLKIWPKDYEIIPYLLSIIGGTAHANMQDDGKVNINSILVDNIREKFGLDKKKEINTFIESASTNFLIGLVSGLYDTDGWASSVRLTIGLSQSNIGRLQAVQRILLYLGIRSIINPARKGGEVLFQDRKVNSKDSFELMIYGKYIRIFNDKIGFRLSYKEKAVKAALNIKARQYDNHYAEVKSVEYIGEEDVYDCFDVPVINAFSGNGFILHNCETVCPGFLKEGDVNKFKRKLALVVQKENSYTGGVYPALVTWYDDEKKCRHCGSYPDDIKHDSMQAVLNDYQEYHKYEPSVNEVSLLHKKLQGLVEIVDKKEALDLPDRIYKTIKLEPDKSTLRAAGLIVKRAKSAAVGLILLRELSDGFQYSETEIGQIRCNKCDGRGEYEQIYYLDGDIESDLATEQRVQPCPMCSGEGTVPQYQREAIQIPTPKEQAFVDCLDDHEDIGRLVAYGGFTGTVDRMVTIARKHQWDVLRIDGRGWVGIGEKIIGSATDMLRLFQSKTHNTKTIVIAQAGAGGMGLTLTASPSIFYYSNSFDSEARDQSEQRIHRPGMDYNLGATIIDCLHLPSDLRILENLRKKIKLQSMSLGKFVEEFSIDYGDV